MTLPTAPARPGLWHIVLFLLVLALSLGLRLYNLDAHLTIDEPTWEGRSTHFAAALRSGDLAQTYQSEHPGVLTMWAGAGALRITEVIGRLDLDNDGLAHKLLLPQHEPGVAGLSPLTFWARRLIAVASWLGIVLAAWLIWRWLGPDLALLATTLIALDPFYLAFSRLHHLDGLLTTFVLLSVLALTVYLQRGRRWYDLALSALFAGLAMANKSPGVLLAPWAAGAVALAWLRRSPVERRARWLADLAALLAWGSMALITVVAVWPALRVAPLLTLESLVQGALRQGLNPHELSNYFLGQVRAVPGPAFYPVAWLLRATPWALLGLLGLIAPPKDGRKHEPLALGLFVLGYTLFMASADKQFDRYLLPIFPLVDLLAALGWMRLMSWAQRRAYRAEAEPLRWASPMLAGAMALTLLAMLWPTQPYYTAYYNPLLGGGRAGQRALLTGWGEGLEQVAACLNAKPGAEHLHVASHVVNELAPFFRGQVTLAGQVPLAEPDYYVLYASHAQRGFVPEVMDPLWGVQSPEFVASTAGVDYAWLYPNTFYRDDALAALEQIQAAGDLAQQGLVLNTDATWARQGQLGVDVTVISAYAREDFVLTSLERAAAGKERLWTLDVPEMDDQALQGLVRQALVAHGRQLSQEQVGELSLTAYTLDEHTLMPQPVVSTNSVLGEGARLLGASMQRDILAGTLRVRLRWQCLASMDRDYKVFVHLLDGAGQIVAQRDDQPQGGARRTSIWQPGEVLIDDYVITLPESGLEHDWALRIGMYDIETQQRLPVQAGDGELLGDHIVIDLARDPHVRRLPGVARPPTGQSDGQSRE